MCWINIYLKLLDLLIYNIGKNFISKKFKQYVNTISINIKGVLIKAYNSINIVK